MFGFQSFRFLFTDEGEPVPIDQPASVPVASPEKASVTLWITAALVAGLAWKGLK